MEITLAMQFMMFKMQFMMFKMQFMMFMMNFIMFMMFMAPKSSPNPVFSANSSQDPFFKALG